MAGASETVPGRLTRDALAALVESVARHGMHACNYLLACDMEMDPVPGYRLTSWESGYGDFRCVPDWQTLRRAAWLPKTALVLCDLLSEPTGGPIEIAPR